MQANTSPSALTDALVSLAWSLWAELGVSGWDRRHRLWNIDVEALILLTAVIGDTDPRLRDEATDWCIRYARFVSAVRLRSVTSRLDERAQLAFDEFAATVHAHARIHWPHRGPARPYRPTGKSHLHDLARPSLFGLRQRAIFGTTGRAEIVRILASEPHHGYSVSEIAEAAGYTRRAIDLELESLRLAGLVVRATASGSARLRLADPASTIRFVGPRPRWIPHWPSIVRVLIRGLWAVERTAPSIDIVQRVELARFAVEVGPTIERSGLFSPGLVDANSSPHTNLVTWLAEVAESLARGEVTAFRPGGLIETDASAD